MHGFHKFHDLWAWFIVKEGRIIDQGHSENEEEARDAYETAVVFWNSHEYESE